MGMYAHIAKLWKKPKKTNPVYKERLIELRKEPVTVRIDRPTRLDRARALGYKAKQGFIMVRQKVARGGRKREQVAGGRRPKAYRKVKILSQSYRWVAEMRAQKKYKNCEVLGSYEVAKDGNYYWFEIILLDRTSPVVKKDKNVSWVAGKANKGRVYRGLTGAGKKSRGMYRKGMGAEKIRPSLRANKRKSK